MPKKTVEVLIEGGKATAAPPLGPALGPLGVNIGQVVAEINKKTASFKGMQVPVKVEVDTETKEFTISVGTPPASELIKKEAGVEKGSSNPQEDFVGNLVIEQVIKIAKMKEDSLTGKTLKEKVKEIIGTCDSMGIMVEGVPAKEALKLVNEGKFDKEISEERTEMSEEKKRKLEEEKARLKAEMEKKRAELMAKAKTIVASMSGKDPKVIRDKLKEAKIPQDIINELVPAAEVKVSEAKGR
ncbi:50S ribosomal protein L11 [Candidatus Woesearchaeota archaeon]|nr:MAG: 50S ribosomal protein L11 [Candidatus Woesearchaeota archaeon]